MGKLDGSESVLAVRAEELGRIGSWRGFYPCFPPAAGRFRATLLDRAEFLPRTEELEHGEPGLAYLQVIPYAVLVDRYSGAVFHYLRPAKGGDSRLAGRMSIGLGGHVNPVDVHPGVAIREYANSLLQRCLLRELGEEVRVRFTVPHMTGLLHDDRNDVGRRHLGLVYVCPVDPADVDPQGEAIERHGWGSPAALGEIPREAWETWSAILVDAIDQVLGQDPVRPDGRRSAG